MFAAFATYLMDGLSLDFRERGIRIRYETVGALKLGQLGVDRTFQGCGLGKVIISDALGFAQDLGDRVGCRYVSVDARPGLDAWYERYGFRRNRLMQKRRLQFALEKNRDPDRLATSMRIDIRAFG